MDVAKDEIGKKTLNEFWCQECRGYIYAWLNSAVDGNYTIVCPNCGHEHYRNVIRGVMTEGRCNDTPGVTNNKIILMRSAYQKEKRVFGKVAELRQMEAVGLMK